MIAGREKYQSLLFCVLVTNQPSICYWSFIESCNCYLVFVGHHDGPYLKNFASCSDKMLKVSEGEIIYLKSLSLVVFTKYYNYENSDYWSKFRFWSSLVIIRCFSLSGGYRQWFVPLGKILLRPTVSVSICSGLVHCPGFWFRKDWQS